MSKSSNKKSVKRVFDGLIKQAYVEGRNGIRDNYSTLEGKLKEQYNKLSENGKQFFKILLGMCNSANESGYNKHISDKENAEHIKSDAVPEEYEKALQQIKEMVNFEIRCIMDDQQEQEYFKDGKYNLVYKVDTNTYVLESPKATAEENIINIVTEIKKREQI